MQHDRIALAAACAASLVAAGAQAEQGTVHGHYVMECRDKDGNLKWREEYDNLVTTAGKNDMLDKYLAGSSYTATFYLGLISSVSYSAVSAADTMSSHAGWTEAGATNAPAYSQSARPTTAWSAASGGVKSLSASLTFSITSAGTLKGSFLTTVATKDGTTGTLFSAGTFTGGDRIVANGDTINASYSLTQT
jgi:hypothetical protein